MINIQWSEPYTIKDSYTTKWQREWCIPDEQVAGFFTFWRGNKFKMLADGFSVSKSSITGKWYLYDAKSNPALFKIFTEEPEKPEEHFNLPPYTIKDTSVLRPWQVDAAGKLVSAITQWGSGVDGSEMGLGKTFTACGAIRELDLPFVIVCPKPVINQWQKVINNHFHMGHNMKGIINYELLIRGRKDSDIASFILHRHTKRAVFEWKLPKNTIILWDEAHRLKNFKTKASKSCMLAHKQGYKQLFLSGTIATSPLDLRTIGTCTKMFNNGNDYYRWAYDHGIYRGQWGLAFNNSPKVLKKLHRYLFEERGVRLLRDSIPNFPKTEIIVNAYNIAEEDAAKIREIYDEMQKELAILAKKIKTDSSEMAIRIRALQRAEMLKIPLFEEMIREALETNMSIVVFLNYSDSIDALANRLNTKCIYDGRNENVRQKYIDLFQENKERVLITNIAAAKEGVNLQDLDGNHPRLSLISPPYNVRYLTQCLGRINREDSRSISIQRIIYIAGTQEENLVDRVGEKLQNLTLINNGEITDNDLKI